MSKLVGLTCHLLFVLSLTTSPAEVAAVALLVDYPQPNNYSIVTLTCVKDGDFQDRLSAEQRPAVFLINGTAITAGSALVSEVTEETDESISFVFSQAQEGQFSCRTALGENSSPEPLAGIYKYNFTSGYKYIIYYLLNSYS